MDDVKRSDGNHTTKSPGSGEAHSSPWLTVTEAADRARCGAKLIYREVRARRLRAAHVGGRRELRLRAEWIDTWLDAYTTPQEVVVR
jgi:excisionase family DNA binding protein